MDPITLITAGPTLLRMVGSLFGGKTKEAADSVAGVVDTVRGLSGEVAKQKLGQHIAEMPPEQQAELLTLQAKLAEIQKEREAAQLQAETAQQAQVQETARTEAQSNDEYVRRTRPKLARQSAYVAFGYAAFVGVVFPIIDAIFGTKLGAIDTLVIGTLFAPCLTYMGVRTVDAFSRTGKT